MAAAGWSGEVRVGGVPVAMSVEACSLVSGKTYQVTNTARRILNPGAALTVLDNAVDRTAEVDVVDFLFGKVTFKASYTVVGPVTLTGQYVPTLAVAGVRECTVEADPGLTDVSALTVEAVQRRATLLDVSGSVGLVELPFADLDAGVGGLQTLDGYARAGTRVLLDYLMSSGGDGRVRAWVLLSRESLQAAVDGVVGTTLNFVGSAPSAPATTYRAVLGLAFGA